jgi:hypothetical protein
MRRRLGRDKLIGSGTIHITSAMLRNRGLQTVQLVDSRGGLAGQVQPCAICSACCLMCGIYGMSEKDQFARSNIVPFPTEFATHAGDNPSRSAHVEASTLHMGCRAGHQVYDRSRNRGEAAQHTLLGYCNIRAGSA